MLRILVEKNGVCHEACAALHTRVRNRGITVGYEGVGAESAHEFHAAAESGTVDFKQVVVT